MISYANLGDLGGTPIQLIHVDPLVGAEICWWNMMDMDERHWWNMMKQDETFGIQWRWSSYDPEINLSSPATESVCITAMASGMLWNAIEWLNGFRKGQVLAALVVQTFTQETSRNHCWVVGSCWKPNPWIYQYIAHMCPYNNRYTNFSMLFLIWISDMSKPPNHFFWATFPARNCHAMAAMELPELRLLVRDVVVKVLPG